MESIFLFLQLSQKYLHSNVYTQKWYTLFFLKFRIQSGYMTEPGRYVPSLPANQEQFLQYVRLGGCLHVTDICKESGQLTYRIPHILDLSGCLLLIISAYTSLAGNFMGDIVILPSALLPTTQVTSDLTCFLTQWMLPSPHFAGPSSSI